MTHHRLPQLKVIFSVAWHIPEKKVDNTTSTDALIKQQVDYSRRSFAPISLCVRIVVADFDQVVATLTPGAGLRFMAVFNTNR